MEAVRSLGRSLEAMVEVEVMEAVKSLGKSLEVMVEEAGRSPGRSLEGTAEVGIINLGVARSLGKREATAEVEIILLLKTQVKRLLRQKTGR